MKTIGLALGSGSWRGLAHIGVIKCLVNHGLKISAIAGSSAGAIVGGAYSALDDIQKVEKVYTGLSIKELLFSLADPHSDLSLFKSMKSQLFFENYFGKHNIESLPVKFCAVTTDILTGKAVLLRKGDLAKAVIASSSLPGIFKSVVLEKHLLIDGGTTYPVPVTVAKKMGSDIVIAVNTYGSTFPIKKEKISKLGIFTITQHLVLNNLAQPELKLADVVINPILKNAIGSSPGNYLRNQDAIDAGYNAMEEKIEVIKKLVN